MHGHAVRDVPTYNYLYILPGQITVTGCDRLCYHVRLIRCCSKPPYHNRKKIVPPTR